jgi:hypothetical protein
MEELEEVHVPLQADQRCDLGGAEGRVTPVDDVLEVFSGDFRGRDVQRQNVVGELGERQVFPLLQLVVDVGDALGDVEPTVRSEALENNLLERELWYVRLLAVCGCSP